MTASYGAILEEEPVTMQFSFHDMYQVIQDCLRTHTNGSTRKRFEDVENCFW
jgi:hypothetical protein